MATGVIFERAYQSVLPELLSLRRSDVVTLNIDVQGAVTKAFDVQRALVGMKGRIAEELPGLDARLPEQLEMHAFALTHAYTLFKTASLGVDTLPSLLAEGKELRALLFAEARVSIRRGLFDATALRNLKNDSGHRSLAFDLSCLAQLFRSCPESAGLANVRGAELKRADELAATILTLVARRRELRAKIEAAADVRDRAFTSFVRIYNEARRVVVFLRPHERDADPRVRSLYAKRKARKKNDLPSKE